MNYALLTLLRLNFRGRFRRMLRGARKPRGIVFLILGILVMVSWLVPSLYRATHAHRVDPQNVRIVAPFAILASCLGNLFASFGERAVAFTAAEVDFLFPGPFTRRSLLGYKIFKTALGTLFTALIFSIWLLRFGGTWTTCFAGVWLTIQFIQLFAMSVFMISETVGEKMVSGGRRAIAIIIVALLAIAIGPKLASQIRGNPIELMRQVHASLAGQVLLAPFNVFARAMTAPTSSDLALWGSIGLGIDAIMLAVVIGLDANYLETAAVVSQRRYERIQRIRAGGAGAFRSAGGAQSSARFHIPPLYWLGGAGPIVWRQMTTAVRSSRSLLIVLGIIGVIAATIVMQNRGKSDDSLAPLLGTVAWMNVVFISMLKFDFRDELDRLDLLRSLPIRPAAVAAGEIVTPVLVLSALQAILLIGVKIFLGADWELILCAAAFALPFNILLTGIENLMFLMFPMRVGGLVAGDMQLVGRQMVVFACKFLLLIVALAFAAAIGTIGYILGHQSWPMFGVFAWPGLTLAALSTIPLLARVYSRFDPSTDTPV